MDLCGANFSTASCPQQCLSPATAFQFQNLPTCMDEIATGQQQVAWNITPWTWNPVAEIFDNCMSQYCDYADPSVGGCPYDGVSLTFGFGELESQWYGDTDQWLCKNVDGQVNPDLGGIGVIVSYVMQACISILLLLTLRLIAFLRYWPRTASRMTPSLKSKLEEQEAVLKSIAVEFQEAQCFFMLACQSAVLAVIKALNKDPQFLGTQTMRAVKYNLAMARLVCLGGILPVTFVLYIIHSIGMSSLVICTLSGCTIVLAVCSLFAILTNFSSISLSPLPYQSKLDKCGQNPPPVVFCQGMSVSEPVVNAMVVIFCVSVYLTILGSSICSYVESRPSYSAGKRRNRVISCFTKIRGELEGNLPRPVQILCDVLFLASNIGYFSQFRPFWLDGAIDPSAWSFGQIVAVTIWFQVIIKYLYWSQFGMEGHSDVHIAAPYEITKTKSGYQKAKQVLEADEAAGTASDPTGSHDLLHRQSQDETGEDQRFTVLQRTHAGSILHSKTY